MKSTQNRLQNHNLLYVNCADHLSPNSNSSPHDFSVNLYGQNNRTVRSNHFAHATGLGCHWQSLSGSETDLSTSTENLTHEEKYVLRNSTRQEPQGEETLDSEDNFGGNTGRDTGGGGTFRGGGSSYASMDQSSCNTLIIHRDCEDDFEDEDEEDDEEEMATRQRYALQNRVNSACSGELRSERHHHASADYYVNPMQFHHNYQCLQKQQAQQFVYLGQNSLENPYSSESQHGPDAMPQVQLPRELTGIPKHYLDQSEVLKHLAKEAQISSSSGPTSGMVPSVTTPSISHSKNVTSAPVPRAFFGAEFDLSKLPPPPDYPGCLNAQQIKNISEATTPVATDSSSASSPAGSQGSNSACSGSSASYTTPTTKSVTTASKGSLSRSQPDLSRIGRWDDVGARRNNYLSQRPRTRGKASPEVSPTLLHQRSYDMKYVIGSSFSADIMAMDKRLEAVEDENQRLKAELDLHTSKVSKLQKFEVDIQKVHSAYEDLVKSSNKRDRLHHAVRTKLEMEVSRLQDLNKEYRDQLDVANNHLLRRRLPLDMNTDSDVKREILKRDQLIAQLIQTNKELTAAKERHEIELAAQRATLQEQRTHIDILDSALSNAQANVVKLEEECRKKQSYVERVAQLQKALNALQVASERREQMERKLRKQLERDLHELRQQHHHAQHLETKDGQQANAADMPAATLNGGAGNLHNATQYKDEGLEGSICSNAAEAVIDLKRAMREKEERIIALETEVSKWEQRYLEENAIRQIAIDAASMPKDAKIAALERTSQESEKLIAQARSEKLKQMDELHASNKRCADMESKIKDLESHLAERDAMIKVLQKHSMEKDAAFQNAMLRSPRHTPHPSFHSVNPSVMSGARSSSLSAVPPDGDGTLGNGASGSLPGLLPSEASAGNPSDESLDEQLKKLDSQLLSKDSIIHALRSEKEKYPGHYWMV